jgi:hypothetical protein
MSPYRVFRLVLFLVFVAVLVLGLYLLTGPAYAGIAALLGLVAGFLSPLRAYLLPAVPPLPIDRLEDYLGKGRDRAPKRFRDFGPRWVDFEATAEKEQYIQRRPEADEIFGRLVANSGQKVFMFGEPASGKTVIAFDVGYRFSRQWWWRPGHVYYYALRTGLLKGGSFEKLVQGLHSYPEPALVILDDVHFDLQQAERIVREVRNPNVSFLFICQPQFERFNPPGRAERPPLRDRCDFEVRLEASSSFEGLAKWGARVCLGREITKEEMYALRNECGDDLLILSRYLRNISVDESGSFNMLGMRGEVCGEIAEDFTQLEASTEVRGPELVILVSTFFQYETGVAIDPFLTRVCKYPVSLIEQLVRQGHVKREHSAQWGPLLTMYHRSSARLYLEAARQGGFRWLARLRKIFKPWPACAFREYILSVAPNATQFANKLRLKELARELRVGSSLPDESVFREVFSEREVRRCLTKSFGYACAEDIGRCLESVRWCDPAWGRETWNSEGVKQAVVDALKRGDAQGIGLCFRFLHAADPAWAKEVWRSLGVKEAVAEAVKRGASEDTARCISCLHRCEPAWASDVWEMPNVKETVAERLKKADAFGIGFCLYHLHKCNPPWATEIGDSPGMREAIVEALKAGDALGILRCLSALVICGLKLGLAKEVGLKEAVAQAIGKGDPLLLVVGFALCFLDAEFWERLPDDFWGRLPEELRPLVMELRDKVLEWERGTG